LIKNTAGQTIGAQLISATDGSAFTGAVTVAVTGDGGTQATGSVGSGACTHEGNGFHTYAPAQAETDYDHVAFTFTGTGAVPVTIQIYTTFPQTGDSFTRLGAPAGASVSDDIATAGGNIDLILADTGTDGVLISMAQSLPGTPTADTIGDALKQATREESPKKNTALSDIPFYMVDSTDHVTPETGLTVAAEVSQDGGATFSAAGGSVTEATNGLYWFSATADDMNGDVIVFRFSASGADSRLVAFQTVE
jgi:hypothetical protein